LEEINIAFGANVVVRMDEITDQEAHKEIGFASESENVKPSARDRSVELNA
jgi:hypothetical protein